MIELQWNNLSFDGLPHCYDVAIGALHDDCLDAN